MTEQLKPCPFCGGEADECETTGWLACTSPRCPAFNCLATEADWNHRATLDSERPDASDMNRELLNALEKMVKAMVDYEMDVDSLAPKNHRDMMNEARAAIAKARGEA